MVSDVRLARNLRLVSEGDSLDGVLMRLVDRALMLTEVERFQPPDPLPSRLEERLAEARRRVGEASWADELQRNGVEEPYVRAFLRDDLRLEAYLRQRFGVLAEPTEAEVASALAADPGSAGAPSPEAARDALRAALGTKRFAALVDGWLAELRTRTDVSVYGIPGGAADGGRLDAITVLDPRMPSPPMVEAGAAQARNP
jgi:hypothetical protein